MNLPPAKRGVHRLDYEGLAKKLTDPETGFGFSQPLSGSPPKTGVMVARKGTEEKIPGVASPDDIRAFAERHVEDLEAHPKAHLGGWVYEGDTYLDVSQRFPAKGQQAMHAQSANDQISAWDVKKGREVPTQPAFPGMLEPNVDPVFPKDLVTQRQQRVAEATKGQYSRNPYKH